MANPYRKVSKIVDSFQRQADALDTAVSELEDEAKSTGAQINRLAVHQVETLATADQAKRVARNLRSLVAG